MAGTGVKPRRVGGAAKARIASSKELTQAKTTSVYKHEGVEQPEEIKEEILGDRVFGPGEEAAFVRMNVGRTINMQNFNSLRIDVSVTMPCRPSEVNAALDTVSEIVEQRLEEEVSIWAPGA